MLSVYWNLLTLWPVGSSVELDSREARGAAPFGLRRTLAQNCPAVLCARTIETDYLCVYLLGEAANLAFGK